MWCNQMGTVFAEMSSRTALTRHLWMKTNYIKTNFMSFLLNSAFSSITQTILNFYNNGLKIFYFHIFGLRYCLHPGFHVKATQDDISEKSVPIWLHHPVVPPWEMGGFEHNFAKFHTFCVQSYLGEIFLRKLYTKSCMPIFFVLGNDKYIQYNIN